MEYKTLEWVDWFNHRRLLEPIGNIPPAEAEANYYAALENLKMAAQHSSHSPSGKPSALQSKEPITASVAENLSLPKLLTGLSHDASGYRVE